MIEIKIETSKGGLGWDITFTVDGETITCGTDETWEGLFVTYDDWKSSHVVIPSTDFDLSRDEWKALKKMVKFLSKHTNRSKFFGV